MRSTRRLVLAMAAAAATLAGCQDPCDATGAICTWAGTGEAAFNGEGKQRLEAGLYWPVDVSFAPDGTPYVLDFNNHRVRKVDAKGQLVTVIGNDNIGDGPADNSDRTADGALGTDVNLNHPTQIVFFPDGSGLLAAWHNHKLRHFDPATGRVTISCGSTPGFAGDGASARTALLNQPKALALDKSGNIFVVDQRNQRVRRIRASDGVIETVVGTGTKGFGGDQGEPLGAQLSMPTGSNPQPGGALDFDAQGRLYVADTENHRIRRVDFAANKIETVAGNGTPGYGGDDGQATAAQLNFPRDLAISGEVLFIADTENHAVRRVDLASGTITTLAGNGQSGYAGDQGPASKSQLNRPIGVTVGPGGTDLFVSDTYNHRIRKISLGGTP